MLETSPKSSIIARPKSFSKGGEVKKTGYAKVHKGEEVFNKSKMKALKKAIK